MEFGAYTVALAYILTGILGVNLDIRSGMSRPAYIRDRSVPLALVALVTWPVRRTVLGSLLQFIVPVATTMGLLWGGSLLMPLGLAALIVLGIYSFLFVSNLMMLK